MNNERRKKLNEIVKDLESVSSRIEVICDQENDCMDNMPESLQGTDRYDAMENAVDNLTSAVDSIGEAIDSIGEAMA